MKSGHCVQSRWSASGYVGGKVSRGIAITGPDFTAAQMGIGNSHLDNLRICQQQRGIFVEVKRLEIGVNAPHDVGPSMISTYLPIRWFVSIERDALLPRLPLVKPTPRVEEQRDKKGKSKMQRAKHDAGTLARFETLRNGACRKCRD